MKIGKLLLMSFLHFLVMFILMYSMIASFGHFYLNINKVYMALIMTMPMIIIEIALMGKMYENKQFLPYLVGASSVVLIATFIFIRTQFAVNNKSFLQSMIPHHSSAILMCNKASITDPEITELCDEIVETQIREIEIMKELLQKYN